MRVYDVYVNGKYKRSILARGKNKAYQIAEQIYINEKKLPFGTLIYVKERKKCLF